MGVSTNAYLAFGINLGEECPESWGNGFDEYEYVKEKTGLVYPDGAKDSPEMDAYYQELFKRTKELPVEIVNHCSGNYPMYFVAVKRTVHTARRGYPEQIKPEDMVVSEQEIVTLRAFCEEQGIEWKEPVWHLFSYWC
jgi:hypothetical protein